MVLKPLCSSVSSIMSVNILDFELVFLSPPSSGLTGLLMKPDHYSDVHLERFYVFPLPAGEGTRRESVPVFAVTLTGVMHSVCEK